MSIADTESALPDWRRITALSATLLAHAIAVLVLALPLAMPLEPVTTRFIEARIFVAPPPPPPVPPDPQPPPPRSHAPPIPTPAPVTPVSVAMPAVATPIPGTQSLPATATIADSTRDIGSASSGESRVLAYDGALKLRYPVASVRQHEQGTVLLRVRVDARGHVERTEIARSSGHARLDAAAREAVERAHFRPLLRNGVAVPAWGVVPVEFRLDRG